MLGVVLALVWVPVTSHCAWEHVPGFEAFKCAGSSAEPTEKPDCSDDGCSQLEQGLYKLTEPSVSIPAPSLAIVIQLVVFEAPLPVEQPSPVTASPPEIPVCWTFLYRTALPPRAPSLA